MIFTVWDYGQVHSANCQMGRLPGDCPFETNMKSDMIIAAISFISSSRRDFSFRHVTLGAQQRLDRPRSSMAR